MAVIGSDQTVDVAAFPGFGISGYRTLAGEVQWIPLDPAITVFLGGNNSGKSNILRLMHEHMGGIFRSLKESQALNSFNPRVDAPRDRATSGCGFFGLLMLKRRSAPQRLCGMTSGACLSYLS